MGVCIDCSHAILAGCASHGPSSTGGSRRWRQLGGLAATAIRINWVVRGEASGDVDHALRVVVTGSNADGSSSATSQATNVISSLSAPASTAAPVVSGTAKVGEQLSASEGTWTGGATSFAYQWQRCDGSGGACVSITGATGTAYGVGSIDGGNTLRVVVSADQPGRLDECRLGADLPGRRHLDDLSCPSAQPCAHDQICLVAACRRSGLREVQSLRRRAEGDHGGRDRPDAGPTRLLAPLLGRTTALWHTSAQLDAGQPVPAPGPLHCDAPRNRQVGRLQPDRTAHDLLPRGSVTPPRLLPGGFGRRAGRPWPPAPLNRREHRSPQRV